MQYDSISEIFDYHILNIVYFFWSQGPAGSHETKYGALGIVQWGCSILSYQR